VAAVHRGESPMSGSIARKVVASFQHYSPRESWQTKLGTREQEVLNLLPKVFFSRKSRKNSASARLP